MRPSQNTVKPELPYDPQMVWEYTHLYGRPAMSHPCWNNPQLLINLRNHIKLLSDHIDILTLRNDEVAISYWSRFSRQIMEISCLESRTK